MADGKRPCDECGCPIEFIEGPNGKHIPVQKVRTAYVLMSDGKLVKGNVTTSCGMGGSNQHFYVSHYETCSNPGRFSRGGKTERPTRPIPDRDAPTG